MFDGLRVDGLRFGVWGLALGLRVWGPGFEVNNPGFWAWGLGLRD